MKSSQVWIGMVFSLGFCSVLAGDNNLVLPELLTGAGLRSVWQIQLPLKPSEQVERLDVFSDYLYVLTDRNFLFCIDRGAGSVRSFQQIAVAGLPVQPPVHFGKKSVFLVGQEMKIFDPAVDRDQISRTIKLSQLKGNFRGIARNSNTIYVCGSDNRLYAFSAEEGSEEICLFMATADNDSPIYSVLATDERVWFGTAAGNVVAMEPTRPRKIWQFNLSGKMTDPLVLDAGFIYAAGLDTKLYKLNSMTGKSEWGNPFLAGDAIRDPIILGKICVYVYTADTGLHAVDKQTGKAVWNLPQGRAMLSEKDTQSYVYVQPGILTVMDNAAGKKNLSINIAGVDRFAVNSTDSVLYLADKKGRVMAAEPIPENKPGTTKP